MLPEPEAHVLSLGLDHALPPSNTLKGATRSLSPNWLARCFGPVFCHWVKTTTQRNNSVPTTPLCGWNPCITRQFAPFRSSLLSCTHSFLSGGTELLLAGSSTAISCQLHSGKGRGKYCVSSNLISDKLMLKAPAEEYLCSLADCWCSSLCCTSVLYNG